MLHVSVRLACCFGQNIVARPHVAARDAGKCSLSGGLVAFPDRLRVLLMKETRMGAGRPWRGQPESFRER